VRNPGMSFSLLNRGIPIAMIFLAVKLTDKVTDAEAPPEPA
jgi:hypothetical protein